MSDDCCEVLFRLLKVFSQFAYAFGVAGDRLLVVVVVGLGRLLLFTPAMLGRVTLLSAFVALLILSVLFIVRILLQKRRSFGESRLGQVIFAVFVQQVQSFLLSLGIPVVSGSKGILQILLEGRVLISIVPQPESL